MKKLTTLAILLCVMLVSIGIITAQEETTLEERLALIEWVCPADFAGQTLSVYNWSEYMGSHTIQDFEALCGVSVVLDYYDSNESLAVRLLQGNPGFDVVFPGDYIYVFMRQENLLEPINYDNLPTVRANVDPRWLGMYFDPENEFYVPYLWGTFGVAYNKNKVTEPITSWRQVFAHNGPVVWIDDYRNMFSIALATLGLNPNSKEPDDIVKARDFLLENGNNVIAFTPGFKDILGSGEADILLTYNAELYNLLLDCACDDYAYVVPEEGSAVDVGGVSIARGAKNIPLAEAFIDYLHDPYVMAQITNTTAYPTTNKGAIESGYILEELLTNAAVFIPEEEIGRLYFLQPVIEVEENYANAWDELKIFLGR